jgi:hypothetical protein
MAPAIPANANTRTRGDDRLMEIPTAGYAVFRARVIAAWRYLAIIDSDGREICRLDAATDTRITVTETPIATRVAYEVRLRGDDPEFSTILPVRIAGSAIYLVSTGGEPVSRVTVPVGTLTEATDGIIHTHTALLPERPVSEVST